MKNENIAKVFLDDDKNGGGYWNNSRKWAVMQFAKWLDKQAARHQLQSDLATGCPFCGVSAEDIRNFNQALPEPPSA